MNMRNIVMLVAAVALAGCGGNNAACGGTGQACCANNACNVAGNTCQNGVCMAAAMCGKVNLSCCTGNVCTDGSTCSNGKCVMAAACGADTQPCCTTNPACNTGLVCNNGTCGMMMGGNTGDPCTKASDCAGTKATCITKDTQGVTWPGGYCTSQCNPQKNDSMGLNSACPGGMGTCLGAGTMGACEVACSAGTCPRQGYACFQGCEPASRSECDPTKAMSCPQDGGAVIDSDAGTTSPRTCAKIGTDNVGQCVNGCDPLAAQSEGNPSPPCTASEGCYPSYFTGEGTCFQTVAPAQGTGDEGMPCMFLNNCLPGLSCHAENNTAVCRHMCRTGAMPVACPMNLNKKCGKLFSMTPVSTDVLGLCGP